MVLKSLVVRNELRRFNHKQNIHTKTHRYFLSFLCKIFCLVIKNIEVEYWPLQTTSFGVDGQSSQHLSFLVVKLHTASC